jgi:hypothetical protein
VAGYRAIFAYPWDIVDRGTAASLDEIAALGFTTVSAAAVYHSVQAFLPENPRRRWFVAQRSHANYTPDASRYGRLRPAAPMPDDHESFETVAEAVEGAGLDLTAWVVLLHTSLARDHPELAVRPFGGPPQPGVLCPANPEVAEYAVGVAREIDERFAPAALDLETAGWASIPHHHHAKVAVPLGPSGRYLLSLCFCDACRALASPDLPGWAAARVDGELRGAVAPVPVDELIAANPELAAFQEARERVVAGLVRSVAAAVSARVHVVHWGEPRQAGVDYAALAEVCDRLVVLDYGLGGGDAGGGVADAAARAGGDRVIAGVSVCAPEMPDAQAFARKLDAVAGCGVEEISVYNHSLVDRARLRWARA